jgi:hypothetical protein
MNQSEQNIHAVLEGLRTAQPSADFELRLQTALRDAHRQSSATRTPSQWNFVAWAAAALAAGVAIAVTASLRHAHPYQTLQPTTAAAPADTFVPPPVLPHRLERHTAITRQAAQQPKTAVQEASFPAPPMPLTQQERLLLKLTRHDSPVVLIALSTTVREAAFAQDKQQVETFFAPPPPLRSQPIEPETNVSGGTQ